MPPRARPSLAALLLVPTLLGACAGILFHRAAGQSMAAPADTYTCARTELRRLGYRERSHDDEDYRVVAERIDDKVRRPDAQFRRLFDQLIVEIAPDASGNTALKLEAHTFAELQTQRGQTFDEETVRDTAKADARALLQACAS
jgi:hypothetical protein